MSTFFKASALLAFGVPIQAGDPALHFEEKDWDKYDSIEEKIADLYPTLDLIKRDCYEAEEYILALAAYVYEVNSSYTIEIKPSSHMRISASNYSDFIDCLSSLGITEAPGWYLASYYDW